MTQHFRHFERNLLGRDFFITDNHGCWDEVRSFMDLVKFDSATDRLFHGGDMVDRGPQSAECLDWIAQPWFYPIMGNHEKMAIGIAIGHHDQTNYIHNGGQWFIDLDQAQRSAFAETFSTLPRAIEIELPNGEISGIIHAEPLESWIETRQYLQEWDSLSNNRRKALESKFLWGREWIKPMAVEDEKGVISTKIIRPDNIDGIDLVLVGHSPHKNITFFGNMGYIDTGLVYGNKLSFLDLTNNCSGHVNAGKIYWR